MNSKYLKNLFKAGIKAATAVGALAAAALILKSDNSDNKDQAKQQSEKPQSEKPPPEPQAPDKAAPQSSAAKSENNSLAFPDEFYLKPEEIYIPDHRIAGKGDVPYVDLTEKEAVAQGWSFQEKSKSVRITNYHGKALDVVVPSRIGGKRVNEISRLAFHGRRSQHSDIERLQIPGCVVKIGDCAFSCSTVREVVFGSRENGLRVIPKDAFRYCENLRRVILPDTLFEIGEAAFAQCKSLEYIALPEKLFRIGENAFYESGLRGFSTWRPERLNDGSAFAGTPLHETYKLIATQNTEDTLTVLLVSRNAKIKFPKKHVKFKPNSVFDNCSLDFSECIDFDISAIDKQFFFKRNIVVRHGQEGYYFGNGAKVSYIDGAPYPGLLTPIEQSGDHMTVKFTGARFCSQFIPFDYVNFGVRSLKIVTDGMFLTIRSRAFSDPKLERLEIDYYFGAEGNIFLAESCIALREFHWKGKYNKGQYVQYIPPAELISKYLHRELLKAFCSVETPNTGIRSFFDSSIFEGVFKQKYFEVTDRRPERPLKAIDAQIHERHLIPIAIDVLRSTPYQFPNGTKLYSDYLRKHLTYARKFCEKIRPKYPEYAEFLENFK